MVWDRTEPNDHLPIHPLGESPVESEALIDCPNCGRSWEQGQNYCPRCGYGAAQANAASGVGASDVAPPFEGPGAELVSRNKEGVNWGGGQIVAGIILAIISLFSAAAVATVLGSLYPEQEDAVATWIAVHVMALAIGSAVWLLGLRYSAHPLAVLGLSGIHLPKKRTVLLMVAVLATSLVATSVYSVIVDLLDVEILSPKEVNSDIFFEGAAVLLTYQALAFITPISEEIFFRGFIFGGLLPRLGPWRAMAASALVFSAFHLNFAVLIPIFITGFLFAWLYWRTGSLWAAIGAHAGQNALALAVQSLGG